MLSASSAVLRFRRILTAASLYAGYLTATSSEDWSLVLEVCDRASASEANAKEAVKALRREFKCVPSPIDICESDFRYTYQIRRAPCSIISCTGLSPPLPLLSLLT